VSQIEIGLEDGSYLFHLFHPLRIQTQRSFELGQVACSKLVPDSFQATSFAWLAWNEVGRVGLVRNEGLVPAQGFTTIDFQRFFAGWNGWNELFRAQERFTENRFNFYESPLHLPQLPAGKPHARHTRHLHAHPQ